MGHRFSPPRTRPPSLGPSLYAGELDHALRQRLDPLSHEQHNGVALTGDGEETTQDHGAHTDTEEVRGGHHSSDKCEGDVQDERRDDGRRRQLQRLGDHPAAGGRDALGARDLELEDPNGELAQMFKERHQNDAMTVKGHEEEGTRSHGVHAVLSSLAALALL